MQNSMCISTVWENYNINHGPWNSVFSKKKVSNRKRGNKTSQDIINIRSTVVNQKMEEKRLKKYLSYI